MKKKRHFLIFIATTVFLINSCAHTEKLLYLRNIPRDTTTLIQQQTFQTVITNNDILQIGLTSTDDQLEKLFSGGSLAINGLPTNPTAQSSSTGGISGYLVNDKGMIKLPLLGDVKAAGLTKEQLEKLIREQLVDKEIAKDALITVRIANFRITVLGEVGRPGVIPVPSEHITVPEALAQAGDLTVYGNRANVLLVREVDGKRIFKRFSLNYDQMFDKDIYYLHNQDFLYVETTSSKAAQADRSTQLAPYFFSVVSLILVLYTVFR
jgi:polysaccharide export outer membrane protein